MSGTQLLANYVSSTSTKIFSSELPALPKENDVEAKTAYLSSLRANVSKLQGEVNVFLTQRMDEDKAGEASKGGAKKTVDEDKEEEMYGEEDPEKDG